MTDLTQALMIAVAAEASVIGVLWQRLSTLQRSYERVLLKVAHLEEIVSSHTAE